MAAEKTPIQKAKTNIPLDRLNIIVRFVRICIRLLGLDVFKRVFKFNAILATVLTLFCLFYFCTIYSCWYFRKNILKVLEVLVCNGAALTVS